MIKEIRGNLKEVKRGIVAHQLTLEGAYKESEVGKVSIRPVGTGAEKDALFDATLFVRKSAQRNYAYKFSALETGLKRLKTRAEAARFPVFVPGYLGCGYEDSGWDWDYVYSEILGSVFGRAKVDLTIVYSPAYVKRLWTDFGDILMDPTTECIEPEWHGFLAGTHREDIWHWFEETFDLSVAKDLMGLEAEPFRASSGIPAHK